MGSTPRPLVIVTSPFQVARALAIFALVLGGQGPLEAFSLGVSEQDDAREATETLYLGHARALLAGTMPGAVARIAARVRAGGGHPTPRRP